jgi:hypothetical protein
MIKTVIRFPPDMFSDQKAQLKVDVEAWLTEMLGPAVPRNNNKTRRRKKWSVKLSYHDWKDSPSGSIEVFTRSPQDATLVALRWAQ